MEFDGKENPKVSDEAEMASDAQANPETTKEQSWSKGLETEVQSLGAQGKQD